MWDIGPVQIGHTEEHTVPLPPILGGLCLAGGVVLLIVRQPEVATDPATKPGLTKLDGQPVSLAGGFMHGFAQGRMRVDRRFDFLVRRFQRDGQAEFADHFRGFGADDVRAENFAVRFAEKDFHKAVNLADGAGLAARGKEICRP